MKKCTFIFLFTVCLCWDTNPDVLILILFCIKVVLKLYFNLESQQFVLLTEYNLYSLAVRVERKINCVIRFACKLKKLITFSLRSLLLEESLVNLKFTSFELEEKSAQFPLWSSEMSTRG